MENIKIYAFADESSPNIDEQILAMKRNGLDGLEIRNVDGINIAKITIDKAKEVRKKMDDAGLIVWSIGSPIGKIDIEGGDFAAHLEECKHTLELAHIFGAENMRIFSFFMPKDKKTDDYTNEVIDRLGRLTELASGSGVDFCHENEKGIYGDDAERCLDILKNVPTLKAVFDPANFVQCGQNTLTAWELLNPYVKYVHIKDSLADNSVVPAGMGDGNVRDITAAYIAKGGRHFTMEPHLAVFEGFNDLEQEGNESVLATRYTFKSNEEAFDAGCKAFKELLRGGKLWR